MAPGRLSLGGRAVGGGLSRRRTILYYSLAVCTVVFLLVLFVKERTLYRTKLDALEDKMKWQDDMLAKQLDVGAKEKEALEQMLSSKEQALNKLKDQLVQAKLDWQGAAHATERHVVVDEQQQFLGGIETIVKQLREDIRLQEGEIADRVKKDNELRQLSLALTKDVSRVESSVDQQASSLNDLNGRVAGVDNAVARMRTLTERLDKQEETLALLRSQGQTDSTIESCSLPSLLSPPHPIEVPVPTSSSSLPRCLPLSPGGESRAGCDTDWLRALGVDITRVLPWSSSSSSSPHTLLPSSPARGYVVSGMATDLKIRDQLSSASSSFTLRWADSFPLQSGGVSPSAINDVVAFHIDRLMSFGYAPPARGRRLSLQELDLLNAFAAAEKGTKQEAEWLEVYSSILSSIERDPQSAKALPGVVLLPHADALLRSSRSGKASERSIHLTDGSLCCEVLPAGVATGGRLPKSCEPTSGAALPPSCFLSAGDSGDLMILDYLLGIPETQRRANCHAITSPNSGSTGTTRMRLLFANLHTDGSEDSALGKLIATFTRAFDDGDLEDMASAIDERGPAPSVSQCAFHCRTVAKIRLLAKGEKRLAVLLRESMSNDILFGNSEGGADVHGSAWDPYFNEFDGRVRRLLAYVERCVNMHGVGVMVM
eukprot:TRINITY_DN1229_c0_g1_i1.p1 TRINITY_DN1229_c0_g1~~TRINITY_DN1229_c0_g1_i1.p1  ORF type:complete len:657 (+),score=143.34 TRINITY_DN1229_c0_g1_i1:260-2230(+)